MFRKNLAIIKAIIVESLFYWKKRISLVAADIVTKSSQVDLEALLSRTEKALLLICIIIYLVPIWAFAYFPSQDGPSHLANATILSEYNNLNGQFWQQYYNINNFSVPTWLNHLMIVALIKILPTLFAEKILLTGYIVGMVLAFYYCVRCFNLRSGFCVFLVFPFLYNLLFQMGFYSFSYSIITFFLTIGYFFRNRFSFNTTKAIGLFLLGTITFSFHPTSFIMAMIFVVIVSVFNAAEGLRGVTRLTGKVVLDFLARFIPLACLLPVALWSIYFAQSHDVVYLTSTQTLLYDNANRLLHLYGLISFSRIEYLPIILFGLLIFFLLWRSGKRLISKDNQNRVLLVVALAYGAIYMLTPHHNWLNTRVLLLALFFILLLLSANSDLWNFRRGLGLSVFLISLLLITIHCLKYAELNDYLSEYLSASSHMESNTTLLPLSFADNGRTPEGQRLSLHVLPFLHASGYILCTRHINTLDNYEAGTGYFPLIFREQYNPYNFINIEVQPRFSTTLYGITDYILTWQLDDKVKQNKEVKTMLQRVEESYDQIFVSSPRGLTQLWRRKGFMTSSTIDNQ